MRRQPERPPHLLERRQSDEANQCMSGPRFNVSAEGRCFLQYKQGSSNLTLEVQSAAEFRSNPDQTTCDFLMIVKTLISMLRCVWLGLELNSAGTVQIWVSLQYSVPSLHWVVSRTHTDCRVSTPAGLTYTSSNSNLVFPGGLPSRNWPDSALLSFRGQPVLGCRVIWLLAMLYHTYTNTHEKF